MATDEARIEELKVKIPELRSAFKTKFDENIKKGDYDSRDLERLDNEDAYALCFLRWRHHFDESVDLIDESLKFRKRMNLWDLDESSFPTEMTERKGIYYKGKDVDGHPILYMAIKENNATKSEQYAILKQYIAWHVDQHYRSNCEQRCVVLSDMTDCGIGNVSIEMSKFIIACFHSYFPGYLAYLINYNLPTLLSALWTVIMAFLNQEQKQALKIAKKKEIAKYIPEEHLWDHMK